MAEVIVRMKIYAENPEEIGRVEGEVKKIAKVGESKVEELAFGIKVLKTTFVVEESEGLEKLEEKINAINGVSQVEVESVDRAL